MPASIGEALTGERIGQPFLWICIKALLHSFEQMLMLPSWNPPL